MVSMSVGDLPHHTTPALRTARATHGCALAALHQPPPARAHSPLAPSLSRRSRQGRSPCGCVWRGPFCLGSGRGRTEAHAAFLFGPFRCKALLSWAELPQGSLPWPAGGSGAGSGSSIFGGQCRVRGMQVWPHTQAQTSVLPPSELKCLAKVRCSRMWAHIQKCDVQVLRPAAGHSQRGLPLSQSSVHTGDVPRITSIWAGQAKTRSSWKCS